jgi:predicted acyltransferase
MSSTTHTVSSVPSVTPSSSVTTDQHKMSSRLISLDVMRGITIAFMILVNNSGEHAYWPFRHADWNGWTPTDLVFPTFLFLMGTSLVFSFESRLSRGVSKGKLLAHTVKRFFILFLLGLVVNGFPHFPLHTLRIYGVLQRIAICFLIGSVLYLWDRRPASKIALLVVALLGYWILMRWVPVPGFGLPGRDIPLLDKNANLVAYLDRHIFPGRLYEGVRDPEGLLSTIPALGTMLMGMLTGIWLRTQRSLSQKFAWMLGAGVLSTLLGELWNPWFPINKKLWTSSYVLFAAGCSLVGLALCYWAVEIKGWKKGWTFFWLVFGTNAISAYVFSELLSSALENTNVAPRMNLDHFLYLKIFDPIHPPGVGSLIYSICFVLVCWVPVLVLYRKKIFIKV